MNTSGAAFSSMQPHMAKLDALCLAFITTRGDFGATGEEAIVGTGISRQTICRCLLDLTKKGHLIKDGVRQQKSKRWAKIYKAAEFAPAQPEPVDEYPYDDYEGLND